MKTYIVILILLIINSELFAQSLFENAGNELSDNEKKQENLNVDINGYIRGVFYIGENIADNIAEFKSLYGETALKLKADKGEFGNAFAEIRYRNGYQFGKEFSLVELREVYINAYISKFDFRVGKQIVAWGKADGFNPTNNITPNDMTVRSPNADDIRLGNFLIKSKFSINSKLNFEGIWIPRYKGSVLPLELTPLPQGITLGEPIYPDASLKNSGYAFKFNFIFPEIDGSVSYFNGYNPMPGINFGIPEMLPDSTMSISFNTIAYKQQVIGFDFSTTLNNYGLRGEIAYRNTEDDYKNKSYMPNPDLQYVLGIDRTFGDFSIIAQYVGRYVIDFRKLDEPEDTTLIIDYELKNYNRLFFGQTEKITHSVSLRPAISLFYVTLSLETFVMYNITTDELLLFPKLTYSITDALKLSVGANYYYGKENTLYDLIDKSMSSVFFELKASF
ncbi:MAG: hypothetical protein KAT68_09160 [Bacteroidales bacterium]|nr:hypothetical protein [Bacteroidales bacterium]